MVKGYKYRVNARKERYRMFWIGIAISCMIGSLVGVAYLSLVVLGREADERMMPRKGIDERV